MKARWLSRLVQTSQLCQVTLRPVEEPPIQLRAANDDLNSPIGKYLFSSGEEGQATTVIGFFHFAESTGTQPLDAGSSSMPEKGKSDDDDDDDDDRRRRPAKGPVPRIVNLINTHLKELNGLGVPIVAATPVWLCGSTSNGVPQGPLPQGCPAIPPIPVGGDQSCPANPGRWPITFPDLSPEMQAMTGKDVTVFILIHYPCKIRLREQHWLPVGTTSSYRTFPAMSSLPPIPTTLNCLTSWKILVQTYQRRARTSMDGWLASICPIMACSLLALCATLLLVRRLNVCVS